ncbi:MAG TPA: hypothetical protein VIS99_04630 [Terrimicrobiaceae bacterium]
MCNLRTVLLIGLAVFLGGVLWWKGASGRGNVTLSYVNSTLAKVIEAIERQGGVEIWTNADPSLPVTIRLQGVQVIEAIDTLAARIDGQAHLAYVGAPTEGQIAEAMTSFSADSDLPGWRILLPSLEEGFAFGGYRVDPRAITWTITDLPDRSLQTLLDQGAQKTGSIFAVPEEWNPSIAKFPLIDRVGRVAAELSRSAKGSVREVFLLKVQRDNEQGPPQNNRVAFPGRPKAEENVEWAGERVRARIALLPKDEQKEANRQFEEERAFWGSIRNLPVEERRAKIEEHRNKPEVQEREDERTAARYERSTPQQRERWFRNYIERKERLKGAPEKS